MHLPPHSTHPTTQTSIAVFACGSFSQQKACFPPILLQKTSISLKFIYKFRIFMKKEETSKLMIATIINGLELQNLSSQPWITVLNFLISVEFER